MDGPVKYELDRGMAKITLARPESRNTLTLEMLQSLEQALDQAAASTEARLAVMTAEGSAFCAGMDLKGINLEDPETASTVASALDSTFRKLITLPIPLLCGVDGPALGGAVGIALASDLVWVGPEARFAFPETRLGIVPAFVSVIVRRRMAPGKLTGMALTGFTADAHTAIRLGMAEFASPESAASDAISYGRKLMRENSGEAMRRTKKFLHSQFDANLDAELAAARKEFCEAVATESARRGLKAFHAKKSIVWDETN